MRTRREFLTLGLGAGTAILVGAHRQARAAGNDAPQPDGTAITQVFGEGLKLVAIALEYDRVINNTTLAITSFSVAERTIRRVYANTLPALSAQGRDGHYVIIELSPADAGAALYAAAGRTVLRKPAVATVLQTGSVDAVDGSRYPARTSAMTTRHVINPIVDAFRPFEFRDEKTGDVLPYNLFVPENYDKNKAYPLVLFMHDAGATSTILTTTLIQGLGAVSWASASFQARHEAFVLAPQYSTPIVNDRSEASSYLETTVDLVERLTTEYNIDRKRLYATGQSGGAMMSIAMNIKYPDLFAASFLVAGQWDPTVVAPLRNDKLWVVVSEGDLKAYPGENAIMATLQAHGARISRAAWDGRSSPSEFAAAVRTLAAQGSAINYVALKKGTVVPPGQQDDGGSNHVNTWRIAYTIEGIQDWIFQQHK